MELRLLLKSLGHGGSGGTSSAAGLDGKKERVGFKYELFHCACHGRCFRLLPINASFVPMCDTLKPFADATESLGHAANDIAS